MYLEDQSKQVVYIFVTAFSKRIENVLYDCVSIES